MPAGHTHEGVIQLSAKEACFPTSMLTHFCSHFLFANVSYMFIPFHPTCSWLASKDFADMKCICQSFSLFVPLLQLSTKHLLQSNKGMEQQRDGMAMMIMQDL